MATIPTVAFAQQSTLVRPATVRDALAVNIHFSTPKPGEMALLGTLGVGRVRMDVGWHHIEKTKGVYDFSEFDGLMRELDARDLKALLILDYGNALYSDSNKTPPVAAESRDAYCRYAAATVDHFKGRGVLWEIYNEPNNKQFWAPKPDGKAYADLAADAARAIHVAAPGEALCGPGMALVDRPFFEKATDAGLLESIDAVTVHPYRQTAPETFADDLAYLRQRVKDRAPPGKTVPILVGEWGYPVVWVDATTQANYLARQMLFGLSERLPLNVWYDWRRGGSYDGKFSIFGLIDPVPDGRGDYTLKPTVLYDAFAALTRLLGDAHFADRLPLATDASPADYLLAFDGPAGRRYAFWTTGPERPAHVRLPAGTYDLYDVFGRDVGAQMADARGLDHKVSGSPLYAVRTGDVPTTAATSEPSP